MEEDNDDVRDSINSKEIEVKEEELPAIVTVPMEKQDIIYPSDDLFDLKHENTNDEDFETPDAADVNVGYEIHDVMLDVQEEDLKRMIFSSEELSISYKDDSVFISYFWSSKKGDSKIPCWVRFPEIQVAEENLDLVVEMTKEFSAEFSKKVSKNTSKIQYTTKAAVAKATLPKPLVSKIKSLFSLGSIQLYLPKFKPVKLVVKKEKKVSKAKLKESKGDNCQVKAAKTKKVKGPKVKKVKPAKIRKNVATKRVKCFIARLLRQCISSAVKEVEQKRKQMKRAAKTRHIAPAPVDMQVQLNPFSFLSPVTNNYCVPRVDPNEGFDLTSSNTGFEEYYPPDTVHVKFAECPRKTRKKRKNQTVVTADQSNSDVINMDLLWPDLAPEEDDIAADEDYDMTKDLISLEDRSPGIQKLDRGIEDWANIDMFPSYPAWTLPEEPTGLEPINSFKTIRFEDELSGEDLVHKVAENLALQVSKLNSMKRVNIKSVEIKENTASNARSSCQTLQPSLGSFDIAEAEGSPWFSVMKIGTGMSSLGLLRDGYQEYHNGKWIDGPGDHKNHDSGISKGKGSVVVHVAKQMRTTNLKPEEITDANGDVCPYPNMPGSKPHIKEHYSELKTEVVSESKESIEFIWQGWIIDASFMSRFEEHMKNLVDKFSPDGRMSMALALVKEKQLCINTNNLKRIEEVDRKIKFYISVFAKFSLLREKHPSIDTNTMMDLLRSYHRITNDNFKKIVTSVDSNVEVAEPIGIGTSTDDEDLSDQGNMAECQVVDFNESRGVEIGSGSKVVQFFYNDSMSGCKVTFPPVRVSTTQQARHVKALVQHFSGKFASRGVNRENTAPGTGVSIAKVELPKEIVKHIRSCFTKKGMRMYRPGRRTHKGVKKNEKVVATTKPVVLSRDDLFAPTSSSAASRSPSENVAAVDSDQFQSLELTPREYFLRSMMPVLNKVDEEDQPRFSSVMDVNAEEEMSKCQEPEKMADIKSMQKQKKIIVEDDDLSDDTPDEEAFKDSLEAEVFGGGLMPKAFQLKGPRKGRSDRSVGRGGRNECFQKKLEDSQIISGVSYLLDSKNDTLADSIKPNFNAMFKPKAMKRRLKMEDLEEEAGDELFKVHGVKRATEDEIRKSNRLQMKKIKEAGGESEYYDNDTKFVVKLEVLETDNETI